MFEGLAVWLLGGALKAMKVIWLHAFPVLKDYEEEVIKDVQAASVLTVTDLGSGITRPATWHERADFVKASLAAKLKADERTPDFLLSGPGLLQLTLDIFYAEINAPESPAK